MGWNNVEYPPPVPSPPELPGLLSPESYLGSAEAFRVRLLEEEQ